MRRIARLAMIGLTGSLAACGSASGGGATGAVAGANPDVLDACRILDKSAVEQSLGTKVQSTELSAVHDGKDDADRFSQCVFSFGGMNMMVFGAGESSDGASETIPWLSGRIRGQMQQGTKAPSENVDGVGKAALWNEELHMLYVFPADGRYYSFTLTKVGEPDQKAAAIALARKLGL